MSALDTARDHYVSRFERFAQGLSAEPDWHGARRRDALARFSETGLPHTRLEEWRYTNVAALARIPFELARGGATPTRDDVETLSFPVFACSLYVFVDGRYAPELSAPSTLSGEVRVESLASLRAEAPERLERDLGALIDCKEHPFAALNTAFVDDGAVLRIPRGVEVAQPVHVVFLTTGGSGPSVVHPRLLVVAEERSRVSLIQDHVALDPSVGFTNAVSEVVVERGADVRHVVLQREHEGQFHVSNLQVRLERDAHFSAHTLVLGGGFVRNDVGVRLADEGARCDLDGLFVGSGEQLIDNHTSIDHAMPHCESHELYKGVLGGGARGVFRGRVIVRPDAQKTLASQSNPNLLVGGKAEINTKPQLEIHADDVKCSHGSSIGQLDPDALFYLRTRGLGENDARDLLTRGFALEVLERLPVPALAQGLDGTLLDRLAALRPEPRL